MTTLTDRLLKLPDRIMELAIGQIMQHLTIAHVYLDGEAIARQRIQMPLRIVDEPSKGAWSQWVRASDRNYSMLHHDLMALIEEWKARHQGSSPKSEERAASLSKLPMNIPVGETTVFPRAPLPASEHYDSRKG